MRRQPHPVFPSVPESCHDCKRFVRRTIPLPVQSCQLDTRHWPASRGFRKAVEQFRRRRFARLRWLAGLAFSTSCAIFAPVLRHPQSTVIRPQEQVAISVRVETRTRPEVVTAAIVWHLRPATHRTLVRSPSDPSAPRDALAAVFQYHCYHLIVPRTVHQV